MFFPLLNVAAGHIYITLPAFLPRNPTLLSSYSRQLDRAIRLLPESSKASYWEACLLVVEGHRHPVTSGVLSPSGDSIVSGAADGTLYFWDGSTGRHSKDIRGHDDWVTSLAYSIDGAFILSGSADSTVKLWDAFTGDLVYTMKIAHGYECTAVAFANDTSYVISTYTDGRIRLWKPWEPWPQLHEQTLEDRSGSKRIYCVACSPDSLYIASGDSGGINLWHNRPGNRINPDRMWKHQTQLKFGGRSFANPVLAIAFSHCGSKLVSGAGKDFSICLWDVKMGTQIKKLPGHVDYVTAVRFSPDDKQVLSSSADKTIRLWNTRTGKQLKHFVGHSDKVTSTVFSSGGTQILSTSYDKTLRIWDALAASSDPPSGKNDQITLLASSPDGSRVAAATEKYVLYLYDASNGLQLFAMRKHSDTILALDISSDNQLLASASSDATVCIWNMSSGACHKVLSGQTGIVRSLRFMLHSASDVVLGPGSLGGQVKVWDAQIGGQLRPLQGDTSEVLDIAVSPDGKYVAATSSGHLDEKSIIRIWHSSDSTHHELPIVHDRHITTISFSPNSEFLASASRDCACLWKGADGSLIQRYDSGCSDPDRILFSADQKYITFGPFCLPTGLGRMTQQPATDFNYSTCAKYYMNDGWIYHVSSQRRVCWVPPSHRGMMVACSNGVALTTSIGDKVVVLDFTALEVWDDITR